MAQRHHHAALWLCVDNSSSADKGTRRFTQAFSKGRCQEPGTLRLVRHLRAFQSDTPIEAATSTIAGQRSGENISFEEDDLAIPKDRDRVSPLSRPSIPLRTNGPLPCLGMDEKKPLSQFEQELKQRLKRLRADRNWTQADVAGGLGIEMETYKHQENRGRPQLNLIVPLAMLFKLEIHQLLTGRPQPEMMAKPPKKPPSTPKRKSRRRKLKTDSAAA